MILPDEDLILEHIEDFQRAMMCYQAAMLTVKTKFDILNIELGGEQRRSNPIEDIKCRLKEPVSIFDKMKRRNLNPTMANLSALTDIAGVRVICSFMGDLYNLRDCFLRQDDITLIQEKDYIKNPKKNGYRSLHLIVSVPVYLASETKQTTVEVQLRTLAMDLWASSEHKLIYKQDVEDPDVTAALKKCADAINAVDKALQNVKDEVAAGNVI